MPIGPTTFHLLAFQTDFLHVFHRWSKDLFSAKFVALEQPSFLS